MKKILLMPGDGIGPEIITEARKVLDCLVEHYGLDISLDTAHIGGAGYEAAGDPLPAESLAKARAADAILMGSVGGPQWEQLERDKRPERGLLRIRSELGLFANLRPAILYPQLAEASSLKAGIVSGLDIMIVRELTGGIYFGEPRGFASDERGRYGFNTLVYSEAEVARIARTAFEIAAKRNKRVCSIDKANVLEVSELWRETVTKVAADYPDVALTHMYVDNAAMQLVRDPKQFDVIVAGNLFGDILSDQAAMLTGSIGMLPSASLDANGKGLYEPVHGSAPDIAGKGIANPIATILSLAMLLRYSLNDIKLAALIEEAVGDVLDRGLRTPDISGSDCQPATTSEMGGAIVDALIALNA